MSESAVSLVQALNAARAHAADELGHHRVTSTSLAVMAEHMIAAGWPASLDHPSDATCRHQEVRLPAPSYLEQESGGG